MSDERFENITKNKNVGESSDVASASEEALAANESSVCSETSKSEDVNDQEHLIKNQEKEKADPQQAESQESYQELKAKLDQKEKELAEFLDTLKRVQAEMENYRKRMMKEQAQIIECAAQSVLLELLPIIDNLERAIDAAKSKQESSTLLEGVELIHSQLLSLLEKQSVEVINPVGQPFDPMKHEAVMQIESKDHEENIVVEVVQKGYDLKGRLLRPAMVVVAK